jgi:hypothetical protein
MATVHSKGKGHRGNGDRFFLFNFTATLCVVLFIQTENRDVATERDITKTNESLVNL